MNSRDKENLSFLMNSPREDFECWMDMASDDDIDYALELIRRAKSENMLQMIEIQDTMAQFEDDMTDSKKVLEKFKLK
jgi:hypothetical protein